jgi:non-specific serine/threonine protein kinase
MAELLKDLKAARLSGVNMPKAEKSIIVLPFEDMSPGKDNEYFSDGLTEEIITDLSHLHDLLVISRSSAMTFKGTKKTIPEIARAVNVRYVLEGSVRKAGNSLRITAQLIDSATDAHLWAEKFGGTLDDVFDIQEKVSRSIVEALRLKLTPEEKQRIAERPISNVTAYEYYLRAYPEIFNGTEQTLGRAVRYLQNALDIIGDNALILSYMAYAYWMYVNIGARQEEYLTKAEECVKRSLAIDPALGKTHVVLGWIQLFTPGAKFDTGLRHFKKGLELSPEEPWALQGIADIYMSSGKIAAAIPICEKLLKLDPLDFHTNWTHAALPLYDGRYDEALRSWLKLYEMFPEYPQAQFYTALALAYNQNIDQAFAVIDKSASLNPDNVVVKLGLMLKYAIEKDKERAYQQMNPEFRKTCLRDGSYCHNLADIFAILKEKTEALDWLEHAVNRGFINYPLLAEKDPFLANIRGEERFKKLMERVKKEWEEFEV